MNRLIENKVAVISMVKERKRGKVEVRVTNYYV